MKNYELSCLISSQLQEEEIKSFPEKISSLIKSFGGGIIDIKNPIRKKIGYPIKHEWQAWFLAADFNLEPDRMEELKNQIKPLSEILRFMIVNQKPLSDESFDEILNQPGKIIPAEKNAEKEIPEVEHRAKELKEEKVELEEIDKKLEEILGE